MYSSAVLLLLIGAIVASVHADCILNGDTIERGYRLFTEEANNRLALLNTDIVRAKQKLYMVCPACPQPVLVRTCQGRYFDKEIPSVDLPALVEEVVDENCPSPFKAYRIGYKLNTDDWNIDQLKGSQFTELYRSCYDANAVQAKYTKHTIYNYKYWTGRPQNIFFQTDGIISTFAANTYRTGSIFDRFQQLFGKKQTYAPNAREVVLNRGHLAPSNDFLYINDKVATFKYVNVVPQFASVNNGNWKQIEIWVNNYAKEQSPLEVTTGAYGVLQLSDENGKSVPVYLGNNFNPVPEYMYKKVRPTNGGASYVMLTYNNIYNKAGTYGGTCHRVSCPRNLRLTNKVEDGDTICCDPNTFSA